MPESSDKASPRIGQLVWSWGVVGAIILTLLGTGVSFMTSSHPYIADLFFVMSFVLFLSKFLSWDLSKEHEKRRLIQISAISISVIFLVATIVANHYLNWNPSKEQPKSPPKMAEITPTPTGDKTQKPIKPPPPTSAKATKKGESHPTEQPVPKESDKESLKKIEIGIMELKGMVKGQTWGLTSEQLQKLSQRMAPFAPKTQDTACFISCIFGDPDSTKFTLNLVEAFRAAGWKLPGGGHCENIYKENISGIIIVVNPEHSPDLGTKVTLSQSSGAKEFAIILQEAGIEPRAEINAQVLLDRFRIIVGRKS